MATRILPERQSAGLEGICGRRRALASALDENEVRGTLPTYAPAPELDHGKSPLSSRKWGRNSQCDLRESPIAWTVLSSFPSLSFLLFPGICATLVPPRKRCSLRFLWLPAVFFSALENQEGLREAASRPARTSIFPCWLSRLRSPALSGR